MADKCKHLYGELLEIMEAVHARQVKKGRADADGLNDMGHISKYFYRCFDCKREFCFVDVSKAPKWFQRIYGQL